MEVVASLSQGRTAAAQCGLFKHKSVPVIFEPPCIFNLFPLNVNLCRRGIPTAGSVQKLRAHYFYMYMHYERIGFSYVCCGVINTKMACNK